VSAVLDIVLFGGLTATLASGARVHMPSRKAGLLLAFLAVQPGGRATREQAIAVLWSDRADTQARASMRQELVALRKALGPATDVLNVEGERLELCPDEVRIDAVEFDRLARSDSPVDLEAAIALHRGEFLSGAIVRDPSGESWLTDQRNRLHDLLTGALRQLLQHQLRADDLTAAVETARRLATEDPLREDIHRLFACLLALTGRRAEALQHLETTEKTFRTELGIGLEPRTTTLMDDVRSLAGDALTERMREHLAEDAEERGVRATPTPMTPPGREQPAIAVLPLSLIGSDPGLEVFADGLIEGVTGALSRLRSIFVISRPSTQKYRGLALDIPRIGADLGVRYLVLGSVQRDASRVRVRAQLVEAATGAMLWSDHHDGALEEAFDLQDRLTERIVGAIAPSVRMAEIERARRKRPESLAAYDYVMRALPQIWAITRETNIEGLKLVTEAIRLDPNYALAYAYASWCQFWRFANNWAEDLEQCRIDARELVQKALSLDGNDPAVLSIAALSATAIYNDLDEASAYMEKALRIDPNYAWGWNRSGYIHIYRDEIDTALAHFDRMAQLSPFDPLTFNRLVGAGLAHYCAGRYDEAVRLAEQARIERPGLPWAYRVLAAANAERGNMAGAAAAAKALVLNAPDVTIGRLMESMPFQRADIRNRFAAGLVASGIPLDEDSPALLQA
jgi:TolB-like protein/DNA-binding SARP family transcriptional activator